MVKLNGLKRVGENVVEIAKNKGADQAEAYVVSNRVLTIRLVNNAVFEAKSVKDFGVGIRLLKDGGLGFCSSGETSKQAIEKTVEAALQAAKARKLPFKYSFPEPAKPSVVEGIYDPELAKLPPDDAVELAYKMVEESMDYSPKIVDNAGVLNIIEYHTFIVNSLSLEAVNQGTFLEASLTATAKENAKKSEGAESTAGRKLDMFKPEEIGKKAAEMAVLGLKAKKIEEGTYQFVMDAEPSANITIYAAVLTSPMIAKLYYPLFLDKIGEKVANDKITIVDDPLMHGGVNSTSVDDEGVPSRKNIIIEKGVLKSFVYDTFYGALEGKATTGNAFRAAFAVGISAFPGKNYNLEPVPIVLNPYIVPGDWKSEEIVEETRQGVLAKRFHYTRLTNPVRGDFTAVLRMGLYKVENGEVVASLGKARLVDNLLNMLKNVDAVSDKLTIGGSWGDYCHTPILRTKAHITPIS